MTLFRWIFALLVAALVVMVAMSSLKPKPTPATKVQTAHAEKTSITRTVTAAGKLEPVHKVNVSSNITGTLIDLKVGIGSVVKKGQYLGQIDTSRYKAQLDQQSAQTQAASSDVTRAQANLTRLREDAARLKKLFDSGAGNAQDVAQAEAQVHIAEAELSSASSRAQAVRGQLSEAQKTMEWATLIAPVDGTVLATNHVVGERIRGSDFAEDVVLVLGSLDEMEVRIEVGEHDVVYIRRHQLATIEVDALPDMPLQGEVIDSGRDAIVKNAGTDNEVTTFPVWVTLKAPPATAMSGMSAQVSIATETRKDVVAIPIQAVTVRAAPAVTAPPSETTVSSPAPSAPSAPVGSPRSKLEKVVFVVKDGEVHKRKITTGLSSESLVEVTDGLSPGEEVVEGPYRILARQLDEGTHVQVVQE
jgi:HlyD family secretion protein